MAQSCDILISGGGVAGLTAAAAFGAAGFDVVCVDPTPPVTGRDAPGADLRTTAFLQPGKALLERFGIWDHLAPNATPLQKMRIVDFSASPPVERDFDAADISEFPFGWNLPNWLLRRELLARIDALETVRLRMGVATKTLTTRMNEAIIGLSDGGHIRARLVVAADGRRSSMRQAAGIGATTRRYGQSALVCAVSHPRPHGNTSIEIHRSGGPFTLVPLPDYRDSPSSALVWMESGPKVSDLMRLSDEAFDAAMTERSGGAVGALTCVSQRQSWPIISQTAHALTGQRLALMAEAAHVIPPIGAQGLNMSLTDLRGLLDLAQANPQDIGSPRMLDAYAKQRKLDIHMRVSGVDALNRASMTREPALQTARAAGVKLLHDLPPVRRALMKLGLGAS